MTKTRLPDEVEATLSSVNGGAHLETEFESHDDVARSARMPADARACGFRNYLMEVSYRKLSGLNFGRLSKWGGFF